jgi:thiol-disulfide isomerase/thioredoxin
MRTSYIIWLLCLFFSLSSFAQDNFSFTPQHPKAGDLITITYEPAGVLAGNLKFVDAAFYARGGKNISTDDIVLKRIGRKFTGTVQTDTSNSLVYFGFSIDKQHDNNFNNGYYILLTDNDGKIKKGAYQELSFFYQYNPVDVERNMEKALTAIQKEIDLYPDSRNALLPFYARSIIAVKKEEASPLIQKEIEALLKKGMEKEEDYEVLQQLYSSLKLTQQQKLIADLQKQKFPNGKWKINDWMRKFFQEKDYDKVVALTKELINNVNTNPDWEMYKGNIEYYQVQPLNSLYSSKNWDQLQKEFPNYPMSERIASLYNEIAWELQKTSTNLPFAAEVSKKATEWTRQQITAPTTRKPPYLTTKDWERNRKAMFSMYGDTYAMVLYRQGEYKKGLAIAQEVMKMQEKKNPDYNNTYALLAEKVYSPKQYKKEMEEFVKSGTASTAMTDGLKAVYVKEKGSDAGFDTYIDDLKKEAIVKMMEELRKSMISEVAPTFALLDLNGQKVSLSELKGKTVIADFWATWCGPCKASFPAMQKMVERYKSNPDVKFVFIDTWENGDNKEKNAADFIASNKYSFQVLMDNDNKVVESYNVEGIPTKFVIDKNGVIRFRSVGWSGSDDKLISELTAMIDLANTSEPKKVM